MYTLTIQWLSGHEDVYDNKGYIWIMCKITHIKSGDVKTIKIERMEV